MCVYLCIHVQIQLLQNAGQRFTIHLVKIKSKPEEPQVPATESTQGSSEPSESEGDRSTMVRVSLKILCCDHTIDKVTMVMNVALDQRM